MGRIIASLNEKGGVGKTTTVKNLSTALAMLNKRVLVVDLDPSANLTKALGIELNMISESICDVFDKGIVGEEVSKDFAIIKHPEGIDVIASTDDLHDYEIKLALAYQRETLLRNFLNSLKDEYDYILLDCPGGLGLLTINALFAADAVIIPVSPQYLSMESMQVLFKRINQVRKLNRTGKKPELIGILFTMVRLNTNNDKRIMATTREAYKNSNVPIFERIIPLNVKVSESDAGGESIYKYAPNTSASMVHMEFVNEFLKREEELELK